jgi:CheY-like chemotaxis protein
MTDIRLLLVEDEPHWQTGIQHLLALWPGECTVTVASNEAEALAAFQSDYNAILLDWKLANGDDGLELGQTLVNSGYPPQNIVVISGSDAAIMPAHPFRFVPKSRIAQELIQTLTEITDAGSVSQPVK